MNDTINRTLHISRTDEVLAGMLVENTGQHFLDSGGAYGRAWQRNAARVGDDSPVHYFMQRPEAWVDSWGYATLDVFHYLRERLTYEPNLDRLWRLWLHIDDTDRWQDGHKFSNSYGTADAFVEALIRKGWAGRCEFGGGLTYNDENLLSQDFQWVYVDINDCPYVTDGTYIGVSIHGGCDIRGGYTDYRWFECDPYELYDYGDCTFSYECDGSHDPDPNQPQLDGTIAPGCRYTATGNGHVVMGVRGGSADWYWSEGYSDGTGESTMPDKHDWADDDPEGDEHGKDETYAYDCLCGGVLRRTGVYAPCH